MQNNAIQHTSMHSSSLFNSVYLILFAHNYFRHIISEAPVTHPSLRRSMAGIYLRQAYGVAADYPECYVYQSLLIERALVIGLSGSSCAGKSTLADNLCEAICRPEPALISRRARPPKSRHPEAARGGGTEGM